MGRWGNGRLLVMYVTVCKDKRMIMADLVYQLMGSF